MEGGTRRIASSGQSAYSAVTPTPMAMPRTTARSENASSIWMGRRRESAGASSGCTRLPRIAPATLPPRPSRSVCSRYAARSGREPAPSAFRTAIEDRFSFTKALTLTATPMPPTISATRPVSPRYIVSWSQKRRRPGCACA